jgi:hypothetical protein
MFFQSLSKTVPRASTLSTALLLLPWLLCQTNINNECASILAKTPPRVLTASTHSLALVSLASLSNEYQRMPCQNGRSCSDDLNSFICSCVVGWSGLLCLTNIHECSSNPKMERLALML